MTRAGSETARDIPEINTSVPHPARVYDYFLAGKDDFEADKVAAEAAIKAFPKTAESARAARAFLRRVVRFLAAEAGIRQFLDIGSGLCPISQPFRDRPRLSGPPPLVCGSLARLARLGNQ